MKKLVASLLITLALSGCMYQAVSQYDIQRSITICGSIDKIVEIYSNFTSNESVLCATGPENSLTLANQVKK